MQYASQSAQFETLNVQLRSVSYTVTVFEFKSHSSNYNRLATSSPHPFRKLEPNFHLQYCFSHEHMATIPTLSPQKGKRTATTPPLNDKTVHEPLQWRNLRGGLPYAPYRKETTYTSLGNNYAWTAITTCAWHHNFVSYCESVLQLLKLREGFPKWEIENEV